MDEDIDTMIEDLEREGLIRKTGRKRKGSPVYVLTAKGEDDLAERRAKKEFELREEACSWEQMSDDEQEDLLDRAANLFFPDRPEVMPNAEIDKMLNEISQRLELGFRIRRRCSH